jgi:hypothetical protein
MGKIIVLYILIFKCTLPPFEWNYYHSSYCYFTLHPDLETQPCT